MSELKPLICTGCGGHIDRETLTCKSCGTAYRLDDDFKPVRIMLSDSKIKTFSGEVSISREYMLDAHEVAAYSLRKMAESMAEQILPLIEYTTDFDTKHNQYVTYGRLRVVDPHWH